MSRLLILSMMAVFLLGLLAGLVHQRLGQSGQTPAMSVDWRAQADSDCDLHTLACRVSLGDGTWMSLSLSPRPIRMLEPLDIQVSLHGIEAQRVAVDFQGMEMDMGYLRPTLSPLGNGHYQAGIVLPLCTTRQMHWRATVLIDDMRGLGAIDFAFLTQRDGG
ncbi:MAG: hypothetical protein IBX49_08330 [Gammaproteobacteria bacterium]|nr:hypothetical protein [Gammaproteobacteria bacterium]